MKGKSQNTNTKLDRRRFMRLAGASSIGVAGLGATVSANPGKGRGRKRNRGRGNGKQVDVNEGGRGRGKQLLEDSPSLVATVAFPGVPEVENQFAGFPAAPPMGTFDPGIQFNTTSATVTPNGKTIHYKLQFGLDDTKPYVLLHEGEGRYTSRGAVINFDISKEEPNSLFLPQGSYRATARDVVQLYEKGGAFNWSVTRTDVFARPGMNYINSFIIIVWDEDGEDNNGGGPPTNDPDYRSENAVPGKIPEFSSNILNKNKDDPTFQDIIGEAGNLIDEGVSTPGGQ